MIFYYSGHGKHFDNILGMTDFHSDNTIFRIYFCWYLGFPDSRIPKLPDAAGTAAGAGETPRSLSDPLPTHPGIKYFARNQDPLLQRGYLMLDFKYKNISTNMISKGGSPFCSPTLVGTDV